MELIRPDDLTRVRDTVRLMEARAVKDGRFADLDQPVPSTTVRATRECAAVYPKNSWKPSGPPTNWCAGTWARTQ